MACAHRWTSPQDGILRISLILISVFFANLAYGAPQGVSFQPDSGFEDRMEALKADGHDCLPKPYSILDRSFLERLIGKAYDTCLTENTSSDQVRKYAAMAAGSLSPAGVYVIPYAASELKSDAVKCILKAYVEASNGPTAAQKAEYRDKIDTGFQAKDWAGFVGGIPELASAGAKEISQAFVDTTFSGTERIQDAGLFARAYGAIVGISSRDLKELWWKASVVELDEYETFLGQCRYAVAERSLERAAELAENECRALGHAYRIAEQDLVSNIYRNYRTVQNDLIGDSPATITIRNTQLAMKGDIENAKQALLAHLPLLKDIDGRKKELDLLTWQFEQDRKTYAARFEQTRAALDTKHACYALDSLTLDIERSLQTKQDQQSCRRFLYRAGRVEQPLLPDTLVFELTAAGHVRSGEWWAEFDRIRGVLNACDTSVALADRDRLRADMRSRPILRMIDGTCTEMPQTSLEGALDGLAEPVHCQMVSVPTDLIGRPLSEAARHLEDAFLYLASPIAKVEPKEGNTPGTIIDSRPGPGSKVRKWTGVAVTVYGEFPQQDPAEQMATVPRTVGLPQADALGALTSAGLTSAFGEDVPADQESLVPGLIHASSHTEGATLPLGAVVTLIRIGPRPKVTVPSLAGAKTLEEAQAILSGARLVTGAQRDGSTPPDGKTPGNFYASDPPAESEVEMFSIVAPIAYANLMKVPPVLGKPPKRAMDMIDASKFFKLGGVSPGHPVKGDEIPGVIQSVVPAVGTPSPDGTVITMTVSMPRSDAPLPPEPSNDPAEPPQGDIPDADATPPAPPEEPPEDDTDGDKPPHYLGEGWSHGPATCNDTGNGAPPAEVVYDADGGLHCRHDNPPSGNIEDSSWIGRWKVEGRMEGQDTPYKVLGMMEITPQDGNLQMSWMPLKDGHYEKFMDLPMQPDANNVLRAAPELLARLSEHEVSRNPNAGVMEEVLDDSANVLAQIVRTLAISRSGTICSVAMTELEKGPTKVDFTCTRQ